MLTVRRGIITVPVKTSVGMYPKTWGVHPKIAKKNRAKEKLLFMHRQAKYKALFDAHRSHAAGREAYRDIYKQEKQYPIRKVIARTPRIRRDYKGRFAGRF